MTANAPAPTIHTALRLGRSCSRSRNVSTYSAPPPIATTAKAVVSTFWTAMPTRSPVAIELHRARFSVAHGHAEKVRVNAAASSAMFMFRAYRTPE